MSGSDANHDTPTSSPELGLPVGASRSSPDEALANLRAVVHGNALEARDGMYFNGELPLEVFVTIIAHCLTPDEDSTQPLSNLGRVCSGWRKAINGTPSLWTTLELYFGDINHVVRKARMAAKRARGSLKSISLHMSEHADSYFDGSDDDDDDEEEEGHVNLSDRDIMLMQLRQSLREIALHDGAKGIQDLVLNTTAWEDLYEYPEAGLKAVAIVMQFAEFSAVGVQFLTISGSSLPRVPSGAPFFSAMPNLVRLSITSGLHDLSAQGLLLPDVLQLSSDRINARSLTPTLSFMTLQGSTLDDAIFPAFQDLRKIDLVNVHCPNLYGLLNACAWTLEELKIVSVSCSPPSNFLKNAFDSGQKDLPQMLALPRLRKLEVGDSQAALLWTAPTLTSSTFVIESYALKQVAFLRSAPPGETIYGRRITSSEARFKLESLSTFIRNSPGLSSVDLSPCALDVIDQIVISALGCVNTSTLTKIRLGRIATDVVIDRLHTLLPHLTYLHVCSKDHSSRASLPALARLANRLRNGPSSTLTRWLSAWHLKLVAERPSKKDAADTVNKLRIDLRTLLLSLSPTQVDHLTTSLAVNAPPNGLPYAVVKQEVIALSIPNNTPSSTSSSSGRVRRKRSGWKDNRCSPVPAAQSIVDQAKIAMNKWQKKREEEWAIQWFENTPGVQLVWSDEEAWEL